MKITARFITCVSCFILFAALIVASQSMVDAREIKNPPNVVMGTIQAVTFSSIRVNDKDYDISNVPILNVKGKPLARDELKQGAEVEIRFAGDEITSVIIKYKRNMMQ